MALTVNMPQLGESVTEGTIAKWLKAEGDTVTEGEVIVEIENAKAIEEVHAPITGVLTKILLEEGQTAEVFAEIAIIEESRG